MFAFSGHMSFKTIAELLKTAPVFLKRLESFWHSELLYSGFQGYLNGILTSKNVAAMRRTRACDDTSVRTEKHQNAALFILQIFYNSCVVQLKDVTHLL